VHYLTLPARQIEARHTDKIHQRVHKILRRPSQVVVNQSQNLIAAERTPPQFQVAHIFTRFHQLRIALQCFIQFPRNQSVSLFQPVQRHNPLHRIAKDANNLRLRHRLRHALARRSRSKISGRNLPTRLCSFFLKRKWAIYHFMPRWKCVSKNRVSFEGEGSAVSSIARV
jgi:hypothetical protein